MEIEIGRVTHYFSHLCVATLKLNEPLKLGDMIHILGHTTDIVERVTSLEVDHHPVRAVGPGDDVAIKVIEPVHVNDAVFRVTEMDFEPHLA